MQTRSRVNLNVGTHLLRTHATLLRFDARLPTSSSCAVSPVTAEKNSPTSVNFTTKQPIIQSNLLCRKGTAMEGRPCALVKKFQYRSPSAMLLQSCFSWPHPGRRATGHSECSCRPPALRYSFFKHAFDPSLYGAQPGIRLGNTLRVVRMLQFHDVFMFSHGSPHLLVKTPARVMIALPAVMDKCSAICIFFLRIREGPIFLVQHVFGGHSSCRCGRDWSQHHCPIPRAVEHQSPVKKAPSALEATTRQACL